MGMVLTRKPRRGAADFERSEKSLRDIRGKFPLTSGRDTGALRNEIPKSPGVAPACYDSESCCKDPKNPVFPGKNETPAK